MTYDSESFFDGSDDYDMAELEAAGRKARRMQKAGKVGCEKCYGTGTDGPHAMCQDCKGEGWK